MGGDKEVSQQTNAPTNPMVDKTLTKLLTGVQGTFDKTTAAGNPAALTQGWASQLGAAANPDYMRGVAGSTRELADIASGARSGDNDAGYAAIRDQVGTDVNATLQGSGRFGSGSHAGALAQGLASVDLANQQADQQAQFQAISALPGAFAMGQAPGSVQAGVGQQQQQAPWWNLGQASSILAGTAGAGGSTSTMTQPGAPWWQAPVAIGGTLASAFF